MESEMEMDSLVGFRFKPTNEEIILLLKKKRLEPDFAVQTVKEIDFYSFDPWELPRHSEIESKEPIWYFFCRPYYKYAKSKRSHRRTNSGYWKITGKGSDMKAKNKKDVIGRKRILSFYLHGVTIFKEAKPEWVMHEIYIDDDHCYKEDFVVCRLERKRDNKPSISTSDDSESSHLVVAEDTYPNSVLPPNEPVSNRNHVAEKTLMPPSRCCKDYNALDNDFFSELHSPIYPAQGSSYSNRSSNGCDLLSFHCGIEQVDDLINSPMGYQNEYSCEETRQILTPEFNSSKSDVSKADAETIALFAWVNTLFEN